MSDFRVCRSFLETLFQSSAIYKSDFDLDFNSNGEECYSQ